MYDYGSAHLGTGFSKRAQRDRSKKTIQASKKNKTGNTKSVGVSTIVQNLRFFGIALLATGVGIFLLLTKALPNLITISQPVNIIVQHNRQTEKSVYFVHLNPDNNLNFAAEFQNNEQLKLPFSDVTTITSSATDEIKKINPSQQFMQTMYSHILRLLVSEVVEVPVQESTEVVSVADIFSFSLNREVTLSIKNRLHILKYYLYSQKKKQPIQELSVNQVAQKLSDNQALWSNKAAYECPLAVINTTPIQGLAQSYATILEESGGFVIRVSSTAGNNDKSVLYTNGSEQCQALEADIVSLFPHGVTLETNNQVTNEYRAGLVLYLANDAL